MMMNTNNGRYEVRWDFGFKCFNNRDEAMEYVEYILECVADEAELYDTETDEIHMF